MSVQTTVRLNQGDAARERLASIDFVRAAFDAFDVDKSGYLEPQEFRAALTMLGVRGNSKVDKMMSDLGIEDLDGDNTISLDDLDKDGDDRVDFEEYVTAASNS